MVRFEAQQLSWVLLRKLNFNSYKVRFEIQLLHVATIPKMHFNSYKVRFEVHTIQFTEDTNVFQFLLGAIWSMRSCK
jgi:hypothetical protein